MHTHLFASQNAFVLISNGEAEQKICIFWSNTFPCFQMDRVGTKHRVKPLNSLLMSHWLISSLSMAQKSYRHVSSMAGIVLSKHIWKGRKTFVCYVFGMICVECKWRIHNWVCRSSKAFEVFLWPKPACANWNQLRCFLQLPEFPSQLPPSAELGQELLEGGAQRGLAPAEEPQPARVILQQNQAHRGEHFCW